MSIGSSNVVPFDSTGLEKPSGTLPFSELNELATDHLSPSIDKLKEALLRHLDLHMEDLDNNQDIMRWVEVKNRLKQNGDQLRSCFLTELRNDDYKEAEASLETLTLELLDNEELEHKLLWQKATKLFEKYKSAELISHINLTLNSLYPDYKGTYPAMPERICESFSIALKSLSPERDIEEMFFTWFSSHLQSPMEELLAKIDSIIIERGLEIKAPPKFAAAPIQTQTAATPANSSGSTGGGAQPSGIISGSSLSDLNDTVLLDSFADRLMSRLEGMLAEGEIISEGKGARVRTVDLTRVLTCIQSEITFQNQSIDNLHYSVTQALENQGINSKLTRHHEDLINMIGWLFEFIIEDHQLPDEIKKILGFLQIPVLKEAIQDDSFLTNHDHPARALLNAITTSGLEHCTELNYNHHVYMLIEHTVHSIISNHCENPNIFQEALKEFHHNLDLIINPAEEIKPDLEEENLLIEEQSLNDNTVEVDISWDELFVDETDKQVKHQEQQVIDDSTPMDIDDSEPPDVDDREPNKLNELQQTEYDFDEDSEEEIILSRNPKENDKEDILLDLLDSAHPEAVTERKNEPIIIKGLQPGQWIEFVGKGNSHRFRCKLAKLSKDRHRYIFENSSGMRVAEISGCDLKKEIESGSIVIEQDNPVFDRAIQAVMHRFKKR
ncbi:DUF1631 family protein [uncultured Endozoicomonas sp.]|uniref:DUF1631 family protein n=1 Tax=uncultured Endozoicomonas sp. TaxID=432652 RepID=UPI002601D2E6|nr:DUF1631 family protein [uncultured Endozoicomonas sp.]